MGEAGKLHSMTGFAPVSGSFEDWTFTGDIRSVNGRGLDVRCRVPDWVEGLEPALRKAVQGRVARGSVTVSLRVQRDETAPEMVLNEAQLQAALKLLSQIEANAASTGLDLVPTKASDIAAMRGVVEQRETGADNTNALLVFSSQSRFFETHSYLMFHCCYLTTLVSHPCLPCVESI